MPQAETGRLILASHSSARRRLLVAAGLRVECCDHGADEESLKRRYLAEKRGGGEIAEALASEKALSASRRNLGSWVIGGDQLLFCEGKCYSKPSDLAAAAEQLRGLRGRRHSLPTAAALALNGAILWRYSETPYLMMRDFSDAFLADYLSRMGERTLSTVGGYEIEGEGAQLFDSVSGDLFTVQGLPLLPLLAELRRQGLVAK